MKYQCFGTGGMPKPACNYLGVAVMNVFGRFSVLIAGSLFLITCAADPEDNVDPNTLAPNASTPTWSQLLGGARDDYGNAMAIDSSGNSYITGVSHGDMDENSNSGDTTDSNSSSDMFIAKYGSTGVKAWSKLIGTPSNDMGYGIAIDSSNNIYVTGGTNGSLSGTNAGNEDCFIAKYDSEGNEKWIKQFGSSGFERANDIAVDSAGNIYVTGYSDGNIFTNTNLGKADVLVGKFDSEGQVVWVKTFGTIELDKANGVAVDEEFNVYVTGYTEGGFGGTNLGKKDIFIFKLDPNGVVLWPKLIGGAESDSGNAIAVDNTGNIYITGFLGGDFFIGKYDTESLEVWPAVTFGGFSMDSGNDIVLDESGNIYATGTTENITFDGLISSGGPEIFVIKYDNSGVKQWSKLFGSSDVNHGNSIATRYMDGNQRVYVAGDTVGDYGSNPSNGRHDALIMKIQ